MFEGGPDIKVEGLWHGLNCDACYQVGYSIQWDSPITLFLQNGWKTLTQRNHGFHHCGFTNNILDLTTCTTTANQTM